MRKDRLKGLLERSGHNSTSLAEILGVSERQIRRWVNGESDPSGELVASIARALNTSTDYLLGLSDDPSPQMRIDNMTDEERAVVAAMRRGDDKAVMKIIANR